MSEMQDKLQADLERALSKATNHRRVIDRLRKDADKNPKLFAMTRMNVVPNLLGKKRAEVLKEFGVDLADPEAIRNYQACSVAEWQIISWLHTRHLMYSAFLELSGEYTRDPNLSDEDAVWAVCEAFMAASEWWLLGVAFDFDDLSEQLPKVGFSKEELVKVLGGIVAARTKVSGQRSDVEELRKRLTEADERPRKQLLKELPAEVLSVFHELRHENPDDLSLQDLSNEAVRRIRRVGASKDNVAENRQDSRDYLEQTAENQDPELEAAHAVELLHELMDKADLSGQERESFLALGEMTSPEAAEKYGRSAVQVRQENHRALKKLRRAAGL